MSGAASPAELCRQVVDLVGDRAEAQVTAHSGRAALTRFANSFIHQNVAEDAVTVSLKVAAGGRVAQVSTTRVDRDGLSSLVEGTLAAAALRPVDPDWPGDALRAAYGEYQSAFAGAVRDWFRKQ